MKPFACSPIPLFFELLQKVRYEYENKEIHAETWCGNFSEIA
jgi:hypothetical protein